MKIGVIGTGHLGKIHIKCISEIADYEIIGVYDKDASLATELSAQYGFPSFDSMNNLIDQAEVLSIVTPTTTHFEIAKKAIERGKHVFIEKPVTDTADQARILQKLAAEHRVKVQVGHVERFNPALLALKDEIINPAFIEVHRLANFNPRSTDVSVVQDLMIHDIDIILHFIDSPVRDVRANGLSIISNKEDICSARIEFENGAVANLTASRISVKNMRKMRLFQSDAYISIDFLEKKSQVIRIDDVQKGDDSMLLDLGDKEKYITISNIEGPQTNAIKQEFHSFYHAVKQDEAEIVSIQDGLRALELVERIREAMAQQGQANDFIHSMDELPE